MNLAIDIGNTNVHMAWFNGQKMQKEFRMGSKPLRTLDELIFWLEHAHEKAAIGGAKPTKIIVSSVVPDLSQLFEEAIQVLWNERPVRITYELMEQLGLQVKVDNPEEVGADRMINAYAAWQEKQQAAIIVDFGTATTFDVLDGTGAYCGGVIAPGINLSLEALHNATARLPNISVQATQAVIGKNTTAAMQSGIYHGYQGLIQHIVKGIQQEIDGETPRILATGGLAGLFAKGSSVIEQHKPNLTMEGLRLVAEHYTQN